MTGNIINGDVINDNINGDTNSKSNKNNSIDMTKARPIKCYVLGVFFPKKSGGGNISYSRTTLLVPDNKCLRTRTRIVLLTPGEIYRRRWLWMAPRDLY